ncbi:MAG: amidohydrolase [Lachnospiraceae bacterium]|nr:amidohydrolase [Lachnospiraceae bacterium]
MRKAIEKAIKENFSVISAIGDDLFEHPELGFQEAYTEETICRYLDSLSVPYQNEISMHGVKCTIGKEDGYHIAVVADMDALLTSRDGEMIPFHSCGHSIQVAVLLNLITGFVKSGALKALDGKVSFMFAPAEEFIDMDTREGLKKAGKIKYFSGKQNMIMDGLFDDVDLVLSCHVMGPDENHPDAKFDVNSSLAGFLLKRAIFRGQASHAGVIPHLGRNALQAATLSLTAVQMLKDTFSPNANAKVYPILKEGGQTPNVICDHAVIETYIRAADKKNLYQINSQIDQAFIHCAKALETECEIIDTPGYLPLTQNRTINKAVKKNMLKFCKAEQILSDVKSGASGDIGDLSVLLPTIQFGFSGIEGMIHSSHFEITDKVHVYEDTALVLADTILDILEDPELQIRTPDFKERKEEYRKSWLKEKE